METETNYTRSEPSLAGLVRDLRDETSLLIRQEVALAKTEMAEKARTFGRNAIYLAVGGVIAYAGFFFILLTVTVLIALGLDSAGLKLELTTWVAPAIVGVVVGVIGYALVQKAVSTFSRESLAPEKTIQSLKEDKQWTQEKLSRA